MALFGTDSGQDTSGRQQSKKTSAGLTQQKQTDSQQTGSKSKATSEQKTVQLDSKSLGILQSILPALAGGIDSGIDIDALISSNIAEETRKFNEDTVRDINKVTQAVGSRDNSFTAQLMEKGRSDLAVRNAALASTLGMQGAQVNAGVKSSGVTDVAKIAEILKGSTATQTGATGAETQETVNKLIEALTGQETESFDDTSQVGTVDVSQGRDLVDVIGALLGRQGLGGL